MTWEELVQHGRDLHTRPIGYATIKRREEARS